jgi:phage terminase large subunit
MQRTLLRGFCFFTHIKKPWVAGHYIGVNLDADKPSRICNYHPTDGVEYLGMGKVRKLTRSQKNYQDFLRADCGYTFAEWMLFKKA